MAITIVCEGINYLFLLKFRGLKHHPMMLYRWLSLCNFFVFWTNLFTPYICRWNLNDLLKGTMFNALSDWKNLEFIILSVQF